MSNWCFDCEAAFGTERCDCGYKAVADTENAELYTRRTRIQELEMEAAGLLIPLTMVMPKDGAHYGDDSTSDEAARTFAKAASHGSASCATSDRIEAMERVIAFIDDKGSWSDAGPSPTDGSRWYLTMEEQLEFQRLMDALSTSDKAAHSEENLGRIRRWPVICDREGT